MYSNEINSRWKRQSCWFCYLFSYLQYVVPLLHFKAPTHQRCTRPHPPNIDLLFFFFSFIIRTDFRCTEIVNYHLIVPPSPPLYERTPLLLGHFFHCKWCGLTRGELLHYNFLYESLIFNVPKRIVFCFLDLTRSKGSCELLSSLGHCRKHL